MDPNWTLGYPVHNQAPTLYPGQPTTQLFVPEQTRVPGEGHQKQAGLRTFRTQFHVSY